MRYEPVGYIVEYEISALLFLAVIMLRYFSARRFPNQKNRLFAVILWCTAADLVLDVISSLIIDNVFLVPVPVTFGVNTLFYLMQLIMPLLMTAYTLALVEHLNRKTVRRLFPLLLPGLALLLLMLTNPFTHWFFYVDPVRGYVHSTLFIITYLVCLFYMTVTFCVAFRNKNIMRSSEYRTICLFLAIVLISVVVQFLYPALLLSGVAMALAVTMMYFTIQNPDAMLDATTGAFTYEAMLTYLHDSMQERAYVQLVAVKIHNMHRINELVGIENGSLVLRRISELLQEGLGDMWVFRMRGSCFVAITRNAADYAVLSAGIEEKISRPMEMGSTEVLVQATVCCIATAELVSEPISPEEAVNYLETALLQNEAAGGRVNIITAGAEFLDKMQRRAAVEKALRHAIETGQGLELYFQPLWSVKNRRFTSAEVLLRFRHPQLGNIPPDEFVPIAESNGLVTAMDELVVRKACRFIHDNRLRETLGLESVEINLSALEFMHRRLPELMQEIISQNGIDPDFLLLEITETAATESFELLKESMVELRKKGCRFALDDFGTGYANISQVLQLPFSMVKLDRSMLFGSRFVMEDLTRMFARMELVTVAEGVETLRQAQLTESIQVDYIQGYYFARPMDAESFISFLKENCTSAQRAE